MGGAVADVGDGGRASCTVAVDDTGGRVDVIHGAEDKSISSICMMGVHTHLSWPSSTMMVPQKEGRTASQFLLPFSVEGT